MYSGQVNIQGASMTIYSNSYLEKNSCELTVRYICSLQQEDRLLQFEEEKVRKYDLQEDSSSVSLSYLAHLNLSSIASTQGKISLTARSNRLIFLAIKNCFTLAQCMIK